MRAQRVLHRCTWANRAIDQASIETATVWPASRQAMTRARTLLHPHASAVTRSAFRNSSYSEVNSEMIVVATVPTRRAPQLAASVLGTLRRTC